MIVIRNPISAIAATVAAILLSGSAAAFDKSRPLICAMGEAYECARGKACERTDLHEIGAPRFFRIDLAGQVAKGVGAGAHGRTSPIRTVAAVGPLLVMQGMDDAVEGQRGAIGWTASISISDGGMTLTAAGDEGAFLLFGDCLIEE
jgi:hypothetical protein